MEQIFFTVIWVVIMCAMFYFMLIKPQKKQQRETQAMLAAVEVGDYVLTTSGFYGVIVNVDEEDVIVEFGNDKHCRISMQKSAIAQIEKANSESK